MHANHRVNKDAVFTGDIVAVVGLKNTTTGDTLCDPGHHIVLEALEFPEPVIHVAVEPKTKADQDKLSEALYSLSEEDPTFRVRSDEETGRPSSRVWASSTWRSWSTACCVSSTWMPTSASPRWPAARRFAGRSRRSRRLHPPTGGQGRTATWSSASSPPGPAVARFRRQDHRWGHPQECIPSVDLVIEGALHHGVLAGYPTVDIRVLLTYGSYHDVDSSEMAFKIAGSMAIKKALRAASPVLLEPVMAVTVTVPDDFVGAVTGDLSSRRGRMDGMEQQGTSHVIKAQVPLADMFGYSTDLRSRTQGRATYTMQFHSYNQVPESIAKEIIARAHGE